MPFCAVLAVLGTIFAVSAVILYRLLAARAVQVRWWAVAVIAVAVLLSFSGLAFERWFREPALSALKPALWIEKSWDSLCFWLALFWLVGTVIVVWRGGVRLTRRNLVLPVAVAYLGVMLPPTAIYAGALYFRMIGRLGGPVIGLPAQSVSPDGQWRAYCALVQTKGVYPELVCEPNRWFNVSRSGAGVWDLRVLPERAPYRIVWSRDSQVASVWYGDVGLGARDLVKGKAADVADAGAINDPQEITKAVRALLDAHGGAAP